ncbi:MAG TPA: trehalose-phosphatase [Candidatus Aquilonibacter sp.]|nr:trehalose-phosphatase [Candidatus Aquilonibacter sp.]
MKPRARKRGKATCAFDAWPEIVARLRAARRRAIFLDFDGTLVKIQRSPRVVRSSSRVNQALERLVRNPTFAVAIVSGRQARDLRRLLPVRGLRYFGLHGGERDGRPIKLRKASRLALSSAKSEAQERFRNLKGIWIEDKRFSFCVHYRSADKATARIATRILKKALASRRESLHVLGGKKIWEVLPPEVPGKFAAVQLALAGMPAGTPAIYIGDDETDEGVFAVLKNQITVKVGLPGGTRARYFLPAPPDVLRFLSRLEREFRALRR